MKYIEITTCGKSGKRIKSIVNVDRIMSVLEKSDGRAYIFLATDFRFDVEETYKSIKEKIGELYE